ncbi:hypothetical protein AB0G49_36065 [Streptomyces longwoodensis]|uniref:hypothetical protein n=1 Tax=Streptomyces longwoodensis TaxID=68231 RepID=UPI0034064A39
MELSEEQAAELRALVDGRHVPAVLAARARIVLWSGEGRRRKDIAELEGYSATPLRLLIFKALLDDLPGRAAGW